MNNQKITYLVSILLCFTCFAACDNKENENILSRDEMVGVLHDIQLAEAVYQVKYSDFMKREQKDALLNSVLKKHNITQSQLDSSLVWYSDNAEVYMKVNDSVIATLNNDLKLVENKNLKKNSGENRNNYMIANHIFLNSSTPVITFDIDSLQIMNYQNFDLNFSSLGLISKIDTTAEFSVMYTYLDTTIVDKQRILDNGIYRSSKSLSNDTLRSISGYIYIDPKSIQNRNILIYDIQLKDKKEEEPKAN